MEKELVLQKIELINFKGIKNSTIPFDFKETNIIGANRSGKTSHVDAIYFCLFGKNSDDQSKFGIKTFDENGQIINHIDHSVKVFMVVNGELEVFERLIKETWRKEHGSTEKTYRGDETILKINDVPVKVGEFNSKVGAIISDQMFKLLSNPLFFNQLHWEKRRDVLIKMAGEVSNDSIITSLITISNKRDYDGLINALNKNEDSENYRKGLKAKIKVLEDESKGIPHRIAEVDQSKPEVKDWNSLQSQINDKTTALDIITGAIDNSLKKQQKKQQEQANIAEQIGDLKLKRQQLESQLTLSANKTINENKQKYANLVSEIEALEKLIREKKQIIADKEKQIELIPDELEKLREEFKVIKGETFENKEDFTCPTCKQSLPEDTITTKLTELEGNFNANKANKIAENQKTGKATVQRKNLLELEVKQADELVVEKAKELESKIAEKDQLDIVEKPVVFSESEDWRNQGVKIVQLEKSIDEVNVITDEKAEAEKAELIKEIDALKVELKGKSDIEKADKRIEKLMKDQQNLAQQIADLERQEAAAMSFEKAKMDILESKVNGMFKLCKFKMFEEQKNGGQKPDCITLINGVPFSDANTEGKINAGLDIINVFSKHYKIKVPIIIDNRESVSKILEVEGQVINLFVDSNYKTLTVK